MLVSPAVLVALWQIYPDLPSGIVIACAALEVALVEKRGATTPAHVAVFVLAVAFLPWLQVKNLAPAAVLVAGYAVVVVRARLPRPLVLGAVAASLASLALLLLYNHRYFGTWLGLPEPPVRLSRTGDEYILGLLFGRDHGLFVQVPFAVLGVLGLCLALGRLPAAVVATAAATGSVLVLNGTYVINAYGGGSYVGRFMWALIPAVVAWSAVVLQRWEATGKGLGLPAAVIGGVWVYLAVPVLAGAHTYLNVLATGTGWDPVAITGWWAGLDRLVPEFDQVGEIFGYPAVGLVFELALGTLAVAAALLFVRRSRRLLLVRTVAAGGRRGRRGRGGGRTAAPSGSRGRYRCRRGRARGGHDDSRVDRADAAAAGAAGHLPGDHALPAGGDGAHGNAHAVLRPVGHRHPEPGHVGAGGWPGHVRGRHPLPGRRFPRVAAGRRPGVGPARRRAGPGQDVPLTRRAVPRRSPVLPSGTSSHRTATEGR